MKDKKNPYATQKGGHIQPVHNVATNDPEPYVERGDDLRSKGGSR